MNQPKLTYYKSNIFLIQLKTRTMFRYTPKELIECQWNKMRQQKIEHVENKFQSGITSLNGE